MVASEIQDRAFKFALCSAGWEKKANCWCGKIDETRAFSERAGDGDRTRVIKVGILIFPKTPAKFSSPHQAIIILGWESAL